MSPERKSRRARHHRGEINPQPQESTHQVRSIISSAFQIESSRLGIYIQAAELTTSELTVVGKEGEQVKRTKPLIRGSRNTTFTVENNHIAITITSKPEEDLKNYWDKLIELERIENNKK